MGRDGDRWLLHYSKPVGGLTHVIKSKRGAVTLLTPWRGAESILCRSKVISAVPCAIHADSEPFPLSCFEVTGSLFLTGSNLSDEVTLGSGNLKSVCNFLHPFACGIYSSFTPALSLQINSYQQPSLLVMVQL